MNEAAPETPDADVPAEAPRTLRQGWKSVVLVCKACEKRGKGPKKITARQVAKDLGRVGRDAGVPRPRVVLTSCLGACPKKALTVAAVAPSGRITMIALKRGDDAAAAVAALFPLDVVGGKSFVGATAGTSSHGAQP